MRKVISIFLLILFSCTPESKIPENVLNKEKFTDLLYHIEIIDALRTQKNLDLEKDDAEAYERYHMLFQKYNVTEEEFTRSFDHYKDHSELYMEISDTIISRLVREEELVSQKLRDQRWRNKKDQTDPSKSSK